MEDRNTPRIKGTQETRLLWLMNNKEQREKQGRAVIVEGIKCFLWKQDNGWGWTAFEYFTGRGLGAGGKTQLLAVEDIKRVIKRHTAEKIIKLAKDDIDQPFTTVERQRGLDSNLLALKDFYQV